VSLDAERCINCTRCVRFAEEISGSEQLMIINRGEKNYPAAAPGRTFDDPYSMNTIDLCPVGALTSTHFRFKARAWEMNYTPSVCTGCATGCSIDVWVRDNEVLRLTPRHNPDVNQYWMCDEGRLDIDRYNRARLQGAKVKGDIPLSWEDALTHLHSLLKQHTGNTVFVGSAFSSLENLYAFDALARHFGAKQVVYVQHEMPGRGDSFLRRDDVTPNRTGAELVGMSGLAPSQLPAAVQGAGLVVVLEDTIAQGILHEHFAGPLVAFAHHYAKGYEKAELLLGTANELEQPATFVNEKSIAQLTQQARQIRNMTPEDWMGMSKSRLDAAGQLTDRWRHAEHILDVFAAWKLISRLLELNGATLEYEANHKSYFHFLKTKFPVLEPLVYGKKNRKNTFKHSQFEFAIDINARVHKV
jgi:NADH-quinone oxidoreductase subunit G